MATDWKAQGTPDHPDFRLQNYPFFLMNLAAGHYNAALAEDLAQIGVSQPIWRVLMILGDCGTATVTEIASLAVMKVPTITRVLQRMEMRKLIIRSIGPEDARSRKVALTPEGKRELARVKTVASELFRHATRNMTAQEIRQLNRSLRRIHHNLANGNLPAGS